MELRVTLLIRMLAAAFPVVSAAQARSPAIEIPIPQAPKLAVGMSAPSLTAARWVKGNPVRALGNGKVTVINFFASWCPTCRETFAHVSELAQKYRGRAVFLGVSVWEKQSDVENGSYVSKVRAFANGMAHQIPYAVAVDDAAAGVAGAWLGATSYDIPKAFIVNRQGQIAWSGHPLAELDDTLALVVSGRFDMARAAQESNAQIAAMHQLIALVTPVEEAITAKNPAAVVSAIDAALHQKPSLEEAFGPTKFQILLRLDEPRAYAYARELAAGPCKSSSSALNLIAWTIVDDESHLKTPDYRTALTLAKQAFDLGNQSDGCVADTFAFALFKNGDKDKAYRLELKAVRLTEKMNGLDAETRTQIRARLAQFRKSLSPPPLGQTDP